MTPPHEQDAPVAPRPELNDPVQPQVDIALTASLNGTVISISGSGNKTVPVGQAATIFKFTLTDISGKNVQFSTLDAADGTTVCPAVGSGNKSGQLSGITLHNNQSPRWAQFVDANSNNGQLDVSYQWEFTCDAGYTVSPFDPVITNGGKSGPIF